MTFDIKLPDYINKKLATYLVVFLVVCVAGVPFWKMCSNQIRQWYIVTKETPEATTVPDSVKNDNPTYTLINKTSLYQSRILEPREKISPKQSIPRSK